MLPQHLAVKFDLANPADLALPALIPLFHHWIQTEALPDILIDVADYKHVPDGPGIMLIAHEGDYSLDLGAGRPGWRCRRRRGWAAATLTGRLRQTFELALRSAALLTAAELPGGRLRVDTGRFSLAFLDQLNVANDPATAAELAPVVRALLAELYGAVDVNLTAAAPGPGPLTFHSAIPAAPPVAELTARLAAPVGG